MKSSNKTLKGLIELYQPFYYRPGPGPGAPFNFMPQQRYFPPMQAPPMQAPPMNGMPNMPGPPPGGLPNFQGPLPGGMPNIPGAPNAGVPPLQTFLSGANSLMNNAQKFAPYIQQYSPMLKNLPAMWRMYKTFKGTSSNNSPESSFVTESLKSKPTKESFESKSTKESLKSKPRKESFESEIQRPIQSRPSIPKIYQPNYDFLQ